MELNHQNSRVWPTNTTTCNCTAIQGAKYFSFLETRPSNFGSFLYKLSTGILISSFHRALLQSVTFISRLKHSVLQNLDVKIYVVEKFKTHN